MRTTENNVKHFPYQLVENKDMCELTGHGHPLQMFAQLLMTHTAPNTIQEGGSNSMINVRHTEVFQIVVAPEPVTFDRGAATTTPLRNEF